MTLLKTMTAFLFVLLIPSVVLADKSFDVQFAGQQTIDGKNAIAVVFSSDIDSRQKLDSYFSIFINEDEAVEGAWVLSHDPQTVYFSNIKAGTKYFVKVHKGLKAASGEKLEYGWEDELKTRQVSPTIGFDSKGFILPSGLSRGLPVNTLNIDKADIDFFRVKPEYCDEFYRDIGSYESMRHYKNKKLHKYASLVYSGRWDLEINQDLRTAVNIPVTGIKELEQPGVYYAILRGAGHYDYSYNSTWFTVSDLGLHIRTYKNMLQIHAQSLETAKPLKDVVINGLDKDGRVSASVKTDSNGVAYIRGETGHFKFLKASSSEHISFVPMDLPDLDLSEFKIATEPFRPVDLFVYGPRDLYRPGETIVIDGLLRNHDGGMTAGLPIDAEVIQPHGRIVHEFKFRSSHLNHYHYEYMLPKDAITGKWRIRFQHPSGQLKEYEFVVAEFLPERMKLALGSPENQGDILSTKDTPEINLQGDFLYGAPAAGSKADAKVHVTPARELFKEKWPGYEFGDIKARVKQSFDTNKITLDEKGQGRLVMDNRWNEAKSPLWVTANVSVYDSGGRPVVRTKKWQAWPDSSLVGIRSLAENGKVEANSAAAFEIILVDKTGKRLKASGLKAVVIREYRDYYWEFRNDSWQWHFTSQSYPVDRFDINISDNGYAEVKVPVKWGGYRLEVTNPATGKISSFRIWAGWRPDSIAAQGGASRPDRVELVLDKPSYAPNDRAKLTIKAPEGGAGYVFVEADTNLLTIPVTVPVKGKTIEFDIETSWDRHDLYVSAVIVRKGQGMSIIRQGQLPKRAVGLIHLPLDRSERKLELEIEAPDKIEPNQTVGVAVNVKNSDVGMAEAWVTLAAVDIGVLNLTGFKTPCPHEYFFQKRRYSPQMYDIYQRLIGGNDGAWAVQRFGGDAPSLSRGGDSPSTDVHILAISKNAVKIDQKGVARFVLDIPDFNGSVRLMAIAHTGKAFGSSEKEMTIAAPLVTQITMPRFLAMGDKSNIVIDAHNMTDQAQNLAVRLGLDGPVALSGTQPGELALAAGEKTSILFPVSAGQQLGKTRIDLAIKGLVVQGEQKEVKRTWNLDIRPAYPAYMQMFREKIKPGDSFALGDKEMARLMKDTIDIHSIISTSPPINISDHISSLNAYPYGCLEQTTSGIFPHVIISQSDFTTLGVNSESIEKTDEKLKLGIQRLMEKQKANGGFGLWSDKSPESYWLSCYVVDFLLYARQAGYEIPETALSKALDRLKTYVRRHGAVHSRPYYNRQQYKAAARVYAAFVLSRVQGISLGDVRGLYKSVKDDLAGSLGQVHAGLALSLTGDKKLGAEVLKKAVHKSRDRRTYYGDYASNLRDYAVSYYLLASFLPGFEQSEQFLFKVHAELEDREWLSTQERNALVLAGSICLKQKTDPWQARVITGELSKDYNTAGLGQFFSPDGESAGRFEITNTGSDDLYVTVTLAGYPEQTPEPVSDDAGIERRYLTLEGKPISNADEMVFKSGDRMLVELSFSTSRRMPNCLVVDLLPAGLELEDPNLAGSVVIDEIEVDKKSVAQWHREYSSAHTEYRDDRFAAALDIPRNNEYRIFYPVRVVIPGQYIIPPPLIEDMYKPYIRGIGDTEPLITITNP